MIYHIKQSHWGGYRINDKKFPTLAAAKRWLYYEKGATHAVIHRDGKQWLGRLL